MVNYCIVYGCGRNSRSNSQINFFSLPKDKGRQEKWLRAAGREDLLTKINNVTRKPNYRICSKHFTPADVKNKHLITDAVPKLFIPGNLDNVWTDESEDDADHQNIVCNSCSKQINGFRYKCSTCEDYDLCPKCETMEVHDYHCMLRIPKPTKLKQAENLIQKWKQFLKSEKFTPRKGHKTKDAEDSSDDEPIKKYIKSYDSGIDLSEDIKFVIRGEVASAIARADTLEQRNSREQQNRKRKTAEEALKVISDVATQTEKNGIELVFADVNELHNNLDLDMKTELPFESSVSAEDNFPKEKIKDLCTIIDGPSNETKTYLLHELLLRDVAN